jgi:hypothetical protein
LSRASSTTARPASIGLRRSRSTAYLDIAARHGERSSPG